MNIPGSINLCVSLRFNFQGGEVFVTIWVFPKIVVPQNGWFIMENPIKMDDLGVPSGPRGKLARAIFECSSSSSKISLSILYFWYHGISFISRSDLVHFPVRSTF